MKINLGIIFIRNFWLSVLLLAIIVFGIGYFCLIKQDLQVLRPGGSFDINTYEEIISSQKIYLTKLKKLAEDYKKLDQTSLKKLDSIISTHPDLPGLMLAIDRARGISGLKVTNISFTTEKGITKIYLELADGGYENFKAFLKNIEENARIMDVKKLTISVKNKKYSVEINSYYQQ